jgi:hypothetical protein
MDPSPTWFFQFKLFTKSITKKELEKLDSYICHLMNHCFYNLQHNNEIGKLYSLSVFLVHYFLNRLHHFRRTLKYFAENNLKITFQQEQLLFQDPDCKCIMCKFPHIQLENIDESLQQYFTSLKKQSIPTQHFMLSVLEKCFDLQCLHTMIIQQQYPHLDHDIITNYVTVYDNK